MKLVWFELKKIMFQKKGLLIFLICFILKCLTVSLFPELKDERIRVSHMQYDMFMEKFGGEATEEKQNEIMSLYYEYQSYQEGNNVTEGENLPDIMSEEELMEYNEKVRTALLRLPVLEMFVEKTLEFEKQFRNERPSHYFYEYGWRTVYFILQIPDIFFLFFLIMCCSTVHSSEVETNMHTVILSTLYGKRKLYFIKAGIIFVLMTVGSFIFGGSEVLIFACRGFLKSKDVPLYSISMFTEYDNLNMTLGEAYGMIFLFRVISSGFFGLLMYALSVFVKNTTQMIFTCVGMLSIPLVLQSTVPECVLFSNGIQMTGSALIRVSSLSDMSPWIGFAGMCIISVVVFFLGFLRYLRGI